MVTTLLSLEEFREIMEISPWLFYQLDPTKLGVDTTFKVWYQNESLTPSTIARDTVTRSIVAAEAMLANELGYWPAPCAIVGEELPYPHPFDASWWNIWNNERWFYKDVKLTYGRTISIGVEAYSVLVEEAAISFLDSDGDGKYDSFTTAAIPTTITDPDEIVVLFSDSDRSKFVIGPERIWEIRPVTVEIVAGFVTISGPIWLVVDPDLHHRAVATALDPTDTPLTYVQHIKVERWYVDTTQPGHLTYEMLATDTSLMGYQVQKTVTYEPRDKLQGVVIPHVADELPPPYGVNWEAPSKIYINYISGYPHSPYSNRRMDPQYALMVARLAATLLPDRAGASNSETQIDYWRGYPVSGAAKEGSLALAPEDANNPFGMRRGALYAWKQVLRLNERTVAGAIR